MATGSSIFAGKIPRTEEPSGLQPHSLTESEVTERESSRSVGAG